jgi:hypothetical protein
LADTSINLQQAVVFAVAALSAELEGSPFAWLRGLVGASRPRFTEGRSQDVQDLRRRIYTLGNNHKRHESWRAITEYGVADCGQ